MTVHRETGTNGLNGRDCVIRHRPETGEFELVADDEVIASCVAPGRLSTYALDEKGAATTRFDKVSTERDGE